MVPRFATGEHGSPFCCPIAKPDAGLAREACIRVAIATLLTPFLGSAQAQP